jgi:hypothetical protein
MLRNYPSRVPIIELAKWKKPSAVIVDGHYGQIAGRPHRKIAFANLLKRTCCLAVNSSIGRPRLPLESSVKIGLLAGLDLESVWFPDLYNLKLLIVLANRTNTS